EYTGGVHHQMCPARQRRGAPAWPVVRPSSAGSGEMAAKAPSSPVQRSLTTPGTGPDLLVGQCRLDELDRHTMVIDYRHKIIINRFVGSKNHLFALDCGLQITDLERHMRQGPDQRMQR